MARQIGAATRFSFFDLGDQEPVALLDGQRSGSTRHHFSIKLYQQLFAQGTEQEIKEQVKQLEKGRSVLMVLGDAKTLEEASVPGTERNSMNT